MTAPMVDYKIHWLKMMSVPESRAVVGRHDGINGRDNEYEDAVKLFTEDADWKVMGLELEGREEILEALYGGLGNDTIRHVLTNAIVNVIDEDNAESWSYNAIYYSREGRIEDRDKPLPFDGPHRFGDGYARLKRVDGEWQIAAREGGQLVFRRPNEPVALEAWAEKEGKAPTSS